MSSEEETLKRNLTIVGKISPYFAETLKNYDISDPNSEKLLEYCTWEDFNKTNSYHNCIKKDSDYYYSIEKNYSLDDLKKAIKTFIKDDEFSWHLDIMEKKYKYMDTNNLSVDDKKACTLTLSYYTSTKENSDRIKRNTNVLIRGQNEFTQKENWSDGSQYYPILYYISKSLANLPLYTGYTVCSMDIDNKEYLKNYEPGTIITWLNYTSATAGKEISPYFRNRNTLFYIYSFSARDISKFSAYSREKETLYPPFSHFLIFKKEFKYQKTCIYMRQIEIGLYINNIIWIDDKIFNSNWENKNLMEMAYSIKRNLKIIPKISTDCALAFMKSFKPFLTKGPIKYKIISDMNKTNEEESARLVKYMQDNYFDNIEIMIFTYSPETANNELRKLGVNINKYIKVTSSSNDVLQFLISE